ncbi:putative MFS monosaccharide transporter [Rhexocercosporidium sp. MPI-PUGE-AT-0058]|nr:putative MFS monosaccharide transporter [Rhexocercosporidium sp. MPI-PUGE-AT-0058]
MVVGTDTKRSDEKGEDIQHVQTATMAQTMLDPYGPSGNIHFVNLHISDTDQLYSGFRGIILSRYVVLCAAFSAIGGILFGYDSHSQGVISVTLVMPQFLERFPEVSEKASGGGFYKGLMTGMIELGALIGALNQGWIADKISRRYSIIVAVIIFTLGSSLQTASVNYPMLVAARFIGGVGIGMLSMVVPLYISEISPPEIRGSLLVFEEFSIAVGIVEICLWQLPFALQIIPGLLLGIGAFIFLPFSPRWLAAKGREDEALAVLAKLRMLPSTDARVLREWMDIIAESTFQKQVLEERHPELVAKTRTNRLKLEIRTHIGAGLMFFQQFVGINALIYYSPTMFSVLNITQLIGVISSLWTLDRSGRKSILLWGSVEMFISHFIISILAGLYSSDWPSHRPEGWIGVALLLFYMLSFGASWGPVPWAMPAEIFPSSLRAKGVAISTCSNWLNNFIIGLVTPPLVQKTGFGAYVFLAVFCLGSFAWTYLCVPETNGKTLKQMDEVFKDRGNAEAVEKKEVIFLQIVRRMENR